MEESSIVPLCRERNSRRNKQLQEGKKKEGEGPSRYLTKKSRKIVASFIAALLVTAFFIQYCKTEVAVEEEKDSSVAVEEEKDLSVEVEEEENSFLIAQIAQEDTVSVELDKPGHFIDGLEVVQETRETLVERETLPFTTVRVNNPDLDSGIVRVIEDGSEGIIEHTVEVKKEDGRELSRTVVSSEIIKRPVNRVLEYGDKNTFSRGDRIYEFIKAINVTATAYCPGTPGSGCPINERGASQCTGFNNDGYTYTGKKAVAGDGSLTNPHIIAVDPAIIPLKSMVYLEGYGFAVAEDTGSAIKNNSIDLLFDRHDDACRFGRRQLRVYLLADFEQER